MILTDQSQHKHAIQQDSHIHSSPTHSVSLLPSLFDMFRWMEWMLSWSVLVSQHRTYSGSAHRALEPARLLLLLHLLLSFSYRTSKRWAKAGLPSGSRSSPPPLTQSAWKKCWFGSSVHSEVMLGYSLWHNHVREGREREKERKKEDEDVEEEREKNRTCRFSLVFRLDGASQIQHQAFHNLQTHSDRQVWIFNPLQHRTSRARFLKRECCSVVWALWKIHWEGLTKEERERKQKRHRQPPSQYTNLIAEPPSKWSPTKSLVCCLSLKWWV